MFLGARLAVHESVIRSPGGMRRGRPIQILTDHEPGSGPRTSRNCHRRAVARADLDRSARSMSGRRSRKVGDVRSNRVRSAPSGCDRRDGLALGGSPAPRRMGSGPRPCTGPCSVPQAERIFRVRRASSRRTGILGDGTGSPGRRAVVSSQARPSIRPIFWTAAPEAPLPRLSRRATSTAWRCASLP